MPIDVTGARILIVDDNEVNRSILLEQMTSWGFDACASAEGREGIAVVRAAHELGVPVDCIILDYQMPGMTGADVARTIRAMPDINDTPIVMLTSVDQSLSQASYRSLHINAQLIKPARSSALLETLVETIQKHRAPHVADVVERQVGRMAPPEPVPTSSQLPAGAGSIAAGPAVASGEHRVDILVAEDNEVNQLVFTQILSETGLTFEIVGNGRLAVQACGEMNPRMILMDVSMPEMSGLDATGKIREMQEPGGRRVPIIGVTAHALKGDRERCLEAGMDDYLSKPISPKALLDKIERWIGTEASRRIQAG